MVGKKYVVILLSLVYLFGCATPPDQIKAQYVSPLAYVHYDCQQIAIEAQRLTSKIQEVYYAQKKRADNDAGMMAVAWIAFWPALFFISGDRHEALELARLKGEYEALQKAAIEKKCNFTMPQIEQILPQKQEEKGGNE